MTHVAMAGSLRDAVAAALYSNPEIGEAIANQQATEFELRRSRADYLPRVDLQASTGRRELNNVTRRAAGTDHQTLEMAEVGLTASLNLFDGFGREAEIERNLARVDRAANQLLDRSEGIALAVSREYIQIVLQGRIIALAEKNLSFHRAVRARIEQGVAGGGLTTADRQQAGERLKAAEARIIQAKEDFERARIAFFRQVGLPLSVASSYPRLSGRLPTGNGRALEEMIYSASPRIKAAEADVEAARAALRGANAPFLPRVGVEGNVRSGHDIDGSEARTKDNQIRVVGKWNLFAGGADVAQKNAQAQRLAEANMRLEAIRREVREAMAASASSRYRQAELAQTLASQATLGKDVVALYDEQQKAGRRTLLDLLSAQNNYFNAQVLAVTAEHSRDLAEYRMLAAAGRLVAALGLAAPQANSGANALVPGWRTTVARP